MVIGDSSLRGFAKIRRVLTGISITAFGGIEVLELVCILQAGRFLNEWDLTKSNIRNRFQAARDEFPAIRFCTHCYSECANEFKGDLYLVVGLNNILKAERLPFATTSGQNMQNFDKMFEMLDNACKRMFPDANVKYAPVLETERLAGGNSTLTELAIEKVKENIAKRENLKMDPNEPKNRKLFDEDGVHMKHLEGANFWTKVFTENDDTKSDDPK